MGSEAPKAEGRWSRPENMSIDIAALEDMFSSVEQSDDGLTTQEICEMTGLPANRVRGLIRQGAKAGLVIVGRRRVAKDWDGKTRWYTVYSMKAKEAA